MIGNDRRSSIVVACSEGFVLTGCDCDCTEAFFSAECVGDKASVEGVRGDDELCDDDSGLEGSNAGTGTGTWCCVDCRV